MVEILLRQHLLYDARLVLDQLKAREGETPELCSLYIRLDAMAKQTEPIAVAPLGSDRVHLSDVDPCLRIEWEVTDMGLDIARRAAKYSGKTIVRLFSAFLGPRGVRTSSRDIDAIQAAARIDIAGLVRPAVHVAAAGFLCNTGEFIPIARTDPLIIS